MYCTQCGYNIISPAKFCENCGNAVEAKQIKKITSVPSVTTTEQPKHESIKTEEGLMDPNSKPGQIIQIRCDNCNYVGAPTKWSFRTIIGILYLFTLLNVVGILIYFISTNAYVCKNCGERNKLVELLNDRRQVPIKSLSKNTFQAIAIFFLIVGVCLTVLKYNLNIS